MAPSLHSTSANRRCGWQTMLLHTAHTACTTTDALLYAMQTYQHSITKIEVCAACAGLLTRHPPQHLWLLRYPQRICAHRRHSDSITAHTAPTTHANSAQRAIV